MSTRTGDRGFLSFGGGVFVDGRTPAERATWSGRCQGGGDDEGGGAPGSDGVLGTGGGAGTGWNPGGSAGTVDGVGGTTR